MSAPPTTVTNFIFTWNNPDLEDPAMLWKPDKMKYLVFQLEVGQNGTPHYQGYCELHKRQRFQAAKALVSASAHLERREGSAAQARDYAMKEDTRQMGPWEFGEFSDNSPGKRNDLVKLYELAKAGKRKADVLDEHPACYMRHYKAFDHVLSLMRPAQVPRQVILLIGMPGTGKTRYVRETYPDCYITPVDSKGFWFDGYEGHKVALIDDFSGQWPLKSLLRVLHEYPEQLPVKGGFCWWNPEKIFITTNEDFSVWYRREEASERESMLRAINRRITKVTHLPLLDGETYE